MKRPLQAIIMSISLALPALSPAYIVDAVEAVVNGKVITRSEVDRSVEEEALRRGNAGAAQDAKLREEVLGALVDRKLLLGEARKFNIVQVGPEEVEKALDSVKGRFASPEDFMKALEKDEITEQELKDDLSDQILAVKYVDRRIKFFIRVTLDDRKKYYDANKDKLGGRSFGEAQEEIYNLLVENQTSAKLGEYVKELRLKSKIIIFK